MKRINRIYALRKKDAVENKVFPNKKKAIKWIGTYKGSIIGTSITTTKDITISSTNYRLIYNKGKCIRGFNRPFTAEDYVAWNNWLIEGE